MRLFLLATLVILLFVTGCATTGAISKKAFLVEPGWDKKQVAEVMGASGNRQFKGDEEAWQYCRTGMSTDQFTIVWFYRGHTTGITTYQCTGVACGYIGSCTQGFRTIRWGDAPDRTIEFRQR